LASLPTPTEALVIRYSYLWRSDHLAGVEEGAKDRPCAIVLLVETHDQSRPLVTVLPITHSPPRNGADAIKIPIDTKRRLGLDPDRSWIVLTEANKFRWPGPDLRRTGQRGLNDFSYGYLPNALYERVRLGFIDTLRRSPHRAIPRTE
jgi:hypothetical protein